ncbi:MAG TPA: T9SS type A sorting domain-containing protein, partial [Candidatus Kapabacteria bacterium]
TTKDILVGMTKDNTSSDVNAVCSITLIDARGRKLYVGKATPFIEGRSETVINTDSLAAGSYFVILTYTKGKETREFSRLLTVTK